MNSKKTKQDDTKKRTTKRRTNKKGVVPRGSTRDLGGGAMQIGEDIQWGGDASPALRDTPTAAEQRYFKILIMRLTTIFNRGSKQDEHFRASMLFGLRSLVRSHEATIANRANVDERIFFGHVRGTSPSN